MDNKKEGINKINESKASPNEEKAISEDIQKLEPLTVLKEKHDTKEEIKLGEKKEFLEITKEISTSVRDYISAYISLADAKAGFLLGTTIGLLVATYFYGPKIFKTTLNSWKTPEIMTIIGMFCLALSICFALFAVWPRTPTSKRKGFLSWVHIANYSNVGEYLKDLFSATEGRVVEELYELNYDLSGVCKQKYLWLSRAFKWSLAGIIICTGVLIFCS